MSIKKENLKKGYLYGVVARNFYVAVFDGNCFIGIRNKFETEFLDREVLKEDGGTAGPQKELGKIPEIEMVQHSVELLDYLMPFHKLERYIVEREYEIYRSWQKQT